MLKRFVAFLGFVSLVTCSLISARANAATVDFTGTWSGTISGQMQCPGGGTSLQTLDVTGSVLQSGDVVNGVFSARGSCNGVDSITPIGATISGATITSTSYSSDGTPVQFTASVSGTTMSVSVAFVDQSGPGSLSGTLNRTSSQPPSSSLSGTYTGTYTYTFDDRQRVTPQHPGCQNPPTHTFTSSGNGTITVLQIGAFAMISALFPSVQGLSGDGHGNCWIGPKDYGWVKSGTVNGNVIGFSSPEGGATLTVNGNTLATTFGDRANIEGGEIVFNGTRTSTSIPPIVASFTASPTIDPGESTTLTWSVLAATSVSIDNGVGAQPLSGSVTVSPARTTTYTLTATGASGSTTAALTVTARIPLSGIYTGTYTYTFDDRQIVTPQKPGCQNPPIHTFTSSGNGSITVLQTGAFATISAFFPSVQSLIDDHGNCRIGPEDHGWVESGTVNGNVISVEGRHATLTVNGNTLSTTFAFNLGAATIVFNGRTPRHRAARH